MRGRTAPRSAGCTVLRAAHTRKCAASQVQLSWFSRSPRRAENLRKESGCQNPTMDSKAVVAEKRMKPHLTGLVTLFLLIGALARAEPPQAVIDGAKREGKLVNWGGFSNADFREYAKRFNQR